MNLLVTGGCGFIGSHFIDEMLKRDNVYSIVNVDNMSYAANKQLSFSNNERYHHYSLDISKNPIDFLLKSYHITDIVHFAAESHVDNSINDSDPFIQTNIVGTHKLLTDCLKYSKTTNIRFIHVSTDEVFGSLDYTDERFTVRSPYRPNSPYAASKAASDLLVRSFVRTHRFPAIITNCSNNFGPRQHKEKMIPTCIRNLRNKTPIPLYGTGTNIRDWIYVKDHVNMLVKILYQGTIGKQYLIGGDNEMTNIQLITAIKEQYSLLTGIDVDWTWIKYVNDRKGHDLRYAIDNTDLIAEFGDLNYNNFTNALKQTILSYIS